MTVQELRETLIRLVDLLRASDAKASTLKELSEFVESAADFGDLSLKAFVKLAEAGRTPPKSATPKNQPSAKTAADPTALAQEIKNLYESAGDPAVAEEQIRATCGRLTPLKKDALVTVAEGIGLEGMKSKLKGDIVAAVTARLLDRKGAAIRSQLIGRPAAPDSASAPMSGVSSSP